MIEIALSRLFDRLSMLAESLSVRFFPIPPSEA